MSAYTWACQQALVAKLKTGPLLPLLKQRVFDDAAQGVEFPWLEVGDAQTIPDDTTAANGGSDDGVSDFFDLHIWSRHKGKMEVRKIADAIHGMLHGGTFPIEGRASVLIWVRTVRILRDPDGITRHGIVSIEIVHRS